jgi:amyloid beta precursor protein binding protein 1
VTERDLKQNFFLSSQSLGKSRAEQVTFYLQELNDDVNGHHVQQVRLPFVL